MRTIHSNDEDYNDDIGKSDLSMIWELEVIFYLENRDRIYHLQLPSR